MIVRLKAIVWPDSDMQSARARSNRSPDPWAITIKVTGAPRRSAPSRSHESARPVDRPVRCHDRWYARQMQNDPIQQRNPCTNQNMNGNSHMPPDRSVGMGRRPVGHGTRSTQMHHAANAKNATAAADQRTRNATLPGFRSQRPLSVQYVSATIKKPMIPGGISATT